MFGIKMLAPKGVDKDNPLTPAHTIILGRRADTRLVDALSTA